MVARVIIALAVNLVFGSIGYAPETGHSTCLVSRTMKVTGFDGSVNPLGESCKYLLADIPDPSGRCSMRVEVKAETRTGQDGVFPRLVDIRFKDRPTDIRFSSDGTMLFNGNAVTNGFRSGNGEIRIGKQDQKMTFRHVSCDINIHFNVKRKIGVVVPKAYRGVSGLCEGVTEPEEDFLPRVNRFVVADDSDSPNNSLFCRPVDDVYGLYKF